MILYIGNKLSIHGKNPTSVDTLGKQLEEIMPVVSASDKASKTPRFFDMLFHIWKHRKNTRYILIDTYSTSNFLYALACSQLARLLHKKYIPILHGGELPGRLRKNPWLCKLIFQHSFVNVTPSHYLEEAFSRAGYKVQYIPNNIPLENYPFTMRKGISPRLLFVRSLRDPYNPLMAVRVLAKVKEELGTGELCMVGPSQELMLVKLKELAKELGVSDYIRFTGRLSKAEWIELSKEYDIFINTTNADNMPVSIIEAMALGFPIVSTNAGGLPFLIQDNIDGLLVNTDDVNAMADKIINLNQQEDLAYTLSKNARKKAEQFRWEIIRNQWLNLLK